MEIESKQSIILASSKDWHVDIFKELSSSSRAVWFWVRTPAELNLLLEVENPRYIFFLHWSWIVPKIVWSKIECVCFHMTDLPFGRGGSPLQNLILNGYVNTKLTAFQMNDGLDAGPIYCKVDLDLSGTAKDIYIRAGKLSLLIIKKIINLNLNPTKQHGVPTYFKRRTPKQSEIKINNNLNELYDFIRMLDADGYPNAYIKVKNFIFLFSNVSQSEGKLVAQVEIKLDEEGQDCCDSNK